MVNSLAYSIGVLAAFPLLSIIYGFLLRVAVRFANRNADPRLKADPIPQPDLMKSTGIAFAVIFINAMIAGLAHVFLSQNQAVASHASFDLRLIAVPVMFLATLVVLVAALPTNVGRAMSVMFSSLFMLLGIAFVAGIAVAAILGRLKQ